MRQLGLKLSQETIKKRKHASRFKKGHVPANKGKKIRQFMPVSSMKKLQKTQFKKGHKPHNTKAGTGHISVRRDSKTGTGYKYIKLADGHWVPLHRHNYEKYFGKLPKGQMVTFKDGNTMNCSLGNLKALSMAENARRNIEKYHALPEELKQTIKINKAIIKTIKDHEH
jgi:hypothetical protein